MLYNQLDSLFFLMFKLPQTWLVGIPSSSIFECFLSWKELGSFAPDWKTIYKLKKKKKNWSTKKLSNLNKTIDKIAWEEWARI